MIRRGKTGKGRASGGEERETWKERVERRGQKKEVGKERKERRRKEAHLPPTASVISVVDI
jgi:molybdopterin-biosynthesis enzyme MoeA-like protein